MLFWIFWEFENYLCRSWLQVVYPARWIPQKREAASMAASTIEPFFPSELDKRIQAHKKWPIYYNILACCYFYTFLWLALLKSLCSIEYFCFHPEWSVERGILYIASSCYGTLSKKKRHYLGNFPNMGGGVFPNPKTFVNLPSIFLYAKFILRC